VRSGVEPVEVRRQRTGGTDAERDRARACRHVRDRDRDRAVRRSPAAGSQRAPVPVPVAEGQRDRHRQPVRLDGRVQGQPGDQCATAGGEALPHHLAELEDGRDGVADSVRAPGRPQLSHDVVAGCGDDQLLQVGHHGRSAGGSDRNRQLLGVDDGPRHDRLEQPVLAEPEAAGVLQRVDVAHRLQQRDALVRLTGGRLGDHHGDRRGGPDRGCRGHADGGERAAHASRLASCRTG